MNRKEYDKKCQEFIHKLYREHQEMMDSLITSETLLRKSQLGELEQIRAKHIAEEEALMANNIYVRQEFERKRREGLDAIREEWEGG